MAIFNFAHNINYSIFNLNWPQILKVGNPSLLQTKNLIDICLGDITG